MTGDQLSTTLLEALPYIHYFTGKTIVIKIGGSTLGSGDTTLQDVVWLKSLGIEPVIVHGGGNTINDWLNRIGKEAKFVRGLRVTDEETLTVVRMTLAGQVNTELVATIARLGGRAVGITGLDGRLLEAVPQSESLGLVGKVTRVNLGVLETLRAAGYITVIAPLGIGADGTMYNLNADTAAGEIAAALRAEKLIFLTDVPGIMDKAGQLLSQLSISQSRELIEQGVISGGMIPKVRACLRALDGARRTHIIDGRTPHALIRELFTDHGVGTMITLDTEAELTPSPPIAYLVQSVESAPS